MYRDTQNHFTVYHFHRKHRGQGDIILGLSGCPGWISEPISTWLRLATKSQFLSGFCLCLLQDTTDSQKQHWLNCSEVGSRGSKLFWLWTKHTVNYIMDVFMLNTLLHNESIFPFNGLYFDRFWFIDILLRIILVRPCNLLLLVQHLSWMSECFLVALLQRC